LAGVAAHDICIPRGAHPICSRVMTEAQSHVLFFQLPCSCNACLLFPVPSSFACFEGAGAFPCLSPGEISWKHAEKDSEPLNVLLWKLGKEADRLDLEALAPSSQ
jgi:hypothetical protein